MGDVSEIRRGSGDEVLQAVSAGFLDVMLVSYVNFLNVPGWS
jgi:hypothetical protein